MELIKGFLNLAKCLCQACLLVLGLVIGALISVLINSILVPVGFVILGCFYRLGDTSVA